MEQICPSNPQTFLDLLLFQQLRQRILVKLHILTSKAFGWKPAVALKKQIERKGNCKVVVAFGKKGRALQQEALTAIMNLRIQSVRLERAGGFEKAATKKII